MRERGVVVRRLRIRSIPGLEHRLRPDLRLRGGGARRPGVSLAEGGPIGEPLQQLLEVGCVRTRSGIRVNGRAGAELRGPDPMPVFEPRFRARPWEEPGGRVPAVGRGFGRFSQAEMPVVVESGGFAGRVPVLGQRRRMSRKRSAGCFLLFLLAIWIRLVGRRNGGCRGCSGVERGGPHPDGSARWPGRIGIRAQGGSVGFLRRVGKPGEESTL